MLNTVKEIVCDFFSKLSREDISALRRIDKHSLIEYHSTVGRYIRNRYLLWEPDHPLTYAWHKACYEGDETFMVEGVDWHPAHPDAVSMKIIEQMWNKANTEILL